MEDTIENIIIALIGAVIGSGITIPVVIKYHNKKLVMKQKSGKESSLIQAGRDVNGKQ